MNTHDPYLAHMRRLSLVNCYDERSPIYNALLQSDDYFTMFHEFSGDILNFHGLWTLYV